MKKPSKSWKRTRLAVLERVQRVAIEPLEGLSTIYATVCALYVIGFLRFQFFDHSTTFSWIETTQLLATALAGFLVPILTGSILTLHFTSQRLRGLANEDQ